MGRMLRTKQILGEHGTMFLDDVKGKKGEDRRMVITVVDREVILHRHDATAMADWIRRWLEATEE